MNLIKFIRIFLLVLIVIGLGLLATQKMWVPKVVNMILGTKVELSQVQDSTSKEKKLLPDQLSQEELKAIEDAGIDTTSRFEDAQFADGTNISEWAKKNDAGFVVSFDKESFIKQPGAIKSIKREDNKWIFAVDILTLNKEWIPGVDSTGGFFINNNPKIRNLKVVNNTRVYDCGIQNANGSSVGPSLQNTSDFISKIQPQVDNSTAEFGYTAYFDILGTDIFAIYQQCLP
jgi:hypothetical protein